MSDGGAGAPWGYVYRLEFVLRNAADLDAVSRGALRHLSELPGVSRVGIGLSEGAGRRLRYAALEHGAAPDAELEWCHIDAYDDVPLTAMMRSGAPVIGSLDDLASRFAGVVGRQRDDGVLALACVPLPGATGPMGGVIVFYDVAQDFDAEHLRLLEAAARRTAEAVRRVRLAPEGRRTSSSPDDPALSEGRHRASLQIENDPRSAGVARRFLRLNLTAWGVDDDSIDSAELCLSELVNNVIMHAGTDAQLSVHLEEGELGVLVRDGGEAGYEVARAVAEDDAMRIAGRGLALIDALADRWGTHHDDQGTIAWFVLATPAPGTTAQTG